MPFMKKLRADRNQGMHFTIPCSISYSSLLSKNVKIKIHRTIILPVVLYGCETWSLTLTEKCRLRVFENKVLRRIFGPKRDEVTGEWRRLHNEELYVLYSSLLNIRVMNSRRLRWMGHVARMGTSEMHTGGNETTGKTQE